MGESPPVQHKASRHVFPFCLFHYEGHLGIQHMYMGPDTATYACRAWEEKKQACSFLPTHTCHAHIHTRQHRSIHRQVGENRHREIQARKEEHAGGGISFCLPVLSSSLIFPLLHMFYSKWREGKKKSTEACLNGKKSKAKNQTHIHRYDRIQQTAWFICSSPSNAFSFALLVQ